MTRIVVLGGVRKQIQVAIDWSLVRFFPRDTAIMRPTHRCTICHAARHASPRLAA